MFTFTWVRGQHARATFVINCLLFALAAQLTHAAPEAPLPLEAFYRDEAVHNVKLSPDGTHLVALRNIGGDTVLMTLNLATGEVFYPTKTDNQEFKFNWVRWANNDRLLMSLRFDSRR